MSAPPPAPPPPEPPLLAVENLTTELVTRWGVVRPTDGVSFTLRRGEILGIVGESGSGKSITCMALLGVLPPGGRIAGGRVLLDGEDILARSPRDLRRIRGRRIATILQDPMTSLNPLLTVGAQVAEPIRLHQRAGRGGALARAIEALRAVRIPAPELRARDFPHQLSGGMRQRVCGAAALSCDPDILIADEPTTSLDVTIQAQYLDLLERVRDERGLAIIFVTHDLGVVARICDRVAVMYAGRIVELVSVADLFDRPAHPYSRALLAALPDRAGRGDRMPAIPGRPPVLHEPMAACPFAPRCPQADERCFAEPPPHVAVSGDHGVDCWKPALGPAAH
jgi:oligopeptide/dipeptide ABC transporter ATP-binding protein